MVSKKTAAAVLAGFAASLALLLPAEALAGRGFGGGVRGLAHRPVAPLFRRASASAPPKGAAIGRRLEHRASLRRAATSRLAHAGLRDHRRDRSGLALPYASWSDPSSSDGYGTPAYGYPAAGGSEYEDQAAVARVPACRAQDYVVPDRYGEPRRVTVVRC